MFTCSRCKREVVTAGLFCPFCGAAAPQAGGEPGDPYEGRTVAQKYLVHQLLDRGGMGLVYKATHITLDRPVVLKMLNRALLADPSIVQRFQREARAASRLNHPNSISVIDFGQTEDGTLFMAMEFLPGRSLARVIADEFPLDTPRVVKIGSQILAALTEAHALGVLHCDLKPENVMLESRHDETDVVKVLDFGIAKLKEAGGGPRLTREGMVYGTPGYSSPEQARGEELDARSDLYSVGVVLYELVTGKLPFDAATPGALVAKMLVERPVPPSVRRPDVKVPTDLEALIMRALSPEREGRPASAEEFRRDLLACATPGARPVRATPPHDTIAFDAAGAGAVRPAPPSPSAAPLSPVEREDAPGKNEVAAGAEPRSTPRARPGTPPAARPAARSRDGERAVLRDRATSSRAPPRYREVATALPVMAGSVVGALLLGGLVWYGLAWIRGASPEPGALPDTAAATEPSPAAAPPSPPSTAAVARPQPESPVRAAASTDHGKAAGEKRGARAILANRDALDSLPTPPASSGEGILAVVATPGARISIDGHPVGQAPRELQLAQGTYRIRATHPALGTAQENIEVVAGQRKLWTATLAK